MSIVYCPYILLRTCSKRYLLFILLISITIVTPAQFKGPISKSQDSLQLVFMMKNNVSIQEVYDTTGKLKHKNFISPQGQFERRWVKYNYTERSFVCGNTNPESGREVVYPIIDSSGSIYKHEELTNSVYDISFESSYGKYTEFISAQRFYDSSGVKIKYIDHFMHMESEILIFTRINNVVFVNGDTAEVLKYNKEGLLTEKITYTTDSILDNYGKQMYRSIYKYDDKKRLVERLNYNWDDEYMNVNFIYYNEDNQAIEYRTISSAEYFDISSTEVIKYIYDAEGLLMEIIADNYNDASTYKYIRQ